MWYAQFIQNKFYLIRKSFHPIQIYLSALGGNMLICRKGQDHSDINLHVLALFWYLVSSSKYSQWSGGELSKHWKNCESCPAQKVFMIDSTKYFKFLFLFWGQITCSYHCVIITREGLVHYYTLSQPTWWLDSELWKIDVGQSKDYWDEQGF